MLKLRLRAPAQRQAPTHSAEAVHVADGPQADRQLCSANLEERTFRLGGAHRRDVPLCSHCSLLDGLQTFDFGALTPALFETDVISLTAHGENGKMPIQRELTDGSGR